MAEKSTKKKMAKYRPVHEVIKEILKEDWENIYPLAKLYIRGAIVPKNEIAGLIKAFRDARNKFRCSARNRIRRYYGEEVFESGKFKIKTDISEIVEQVVLALKQQLVEAEKKEEK